MLTIRYRTLVEFPGVPAGEIINNITGAFIYTGETYTDFWIDQRIVEDTPAQFEFISAIPE